jgi:poly(3-hydroxybutyrate) depolymerase
MRRQFLVFLTVCGFFITVTAAYLPVEAQSDALETLSLCIPAKESVELGQVDLTLDSGGQERIYVRYIPASYDPNIATPLVLNLHGFMGWASQQAEMTGMSATAETHGFILVNPQAARRTDPPRRRHEPCRG